MASTKTKTAKYVSKYRNLTIAIRSSYFKTAEDGKRELIQGDRVVFTGGFFETDNQELIEKLEARADFGTAFVKVPQNKTVEEMHDKMRQIDEKERELKEREAEIERKEKLLADEEAGRTKGTTSDDNKKEGGKPEVSDKMKRNELEAIASEEGISDEDIEKAETKGALVALINGAREDAKEDKADFDN